MLDSSQYTLEYTYIKTIGDKIRFIRKQIERQQKMSYSNTPIKKSQNQVQTKLPSIRHHSQTTNVEQPIITIKLDLLDKPQPKVLKAPTLPVEKNNNKLKIHLKPYASNSPVERKKKEKSKCQNMFKQKLRGWSFSEFESKSD